MKNYPIYAIGLSTLLIGGHVLAADLTSTKAPIATPVVASFWTGPYAGLNVGYGWANQTAIYGYETRLPPLRPAGLTGASWAASSPLATGFFGGAQLGYNYQIYGTGAVVGAEADFQGAGLSGNADGVGNFNTRHSYYPFYSARQTLNWFGTVRGRVGYAVLPQLLLYGTGGFAYGGGTSGFNLLYSDLKEYAGNSTSSTNTGWTAGGGVEWAVWDNWSVKAEYLYLNLGSTPSLIAQERCFCSIHPDYFSANQTGSSNRFHTLRAGINYHFNLGNIAPQLKL